MRLSAIALLVLGCGATHQLALDPADHLTYSYGSGELGGPHTVLEVSGRGDVNRSDHSGGAMVSRGRTVSTDAVGALFQQLIDLGVLEVSSATSCCDQDFARVQGELDSLAIDVTVSSPQNASAPLRAILEALRGFELQIYGELAD